MSLLFSKKCLDPRVLDISECVGLGLLYVKYTSENVAALKATGMFTLLTTFYDER